MIPLIGAQRVWIVRRTQARSESTGRVTLTSAEPEAALASVQPLSGEDLEKLTDGERTRVACKAYMRHRLRTSEAGGEPSDVLIVDDVSYEAHRVEEYRGMHPIPHYKVMLVRLDEATPAVPE